MKKTFEKHETLFCILLIVAYVMINSYCMKNFGYTSVVSLAVNTLLSLLLIGLTAILKRVAFYGLTKAKNSQKCWYFLPLILIATVNLWGGIDTSEGAGAIAVHMLVMVNIGFLEELIFRGYLYKMMATDNVKSAVIVSTLTFGIGHIVNLLNGADLVPTLIQIVNAMALGYLFVTIFRKSKSLLPCIVTHIVINATSVFRVENTMTTYVAPIALFAVSLCYALWLEKKVKEK